MQNSRNRETPKRQPPRDEVIRRLRPHLSTTGADPRRLTAISTSSGHTSSPRSVHGSYVQARKMDGVVPSRVRVEGQFGAPQQSIGTISAQNPLNIEPEITAVSAVAGSLAKLRAANDFLQTAGLTFPLARRSGNCRPKGARRVGPDREAPERSEGQSGRAQAFPQNLGPERRTRSRLKRFIPLRKADVSPSSDVHHQTAESAASQLAFGRCGRADRCGW